LRAKRPSSRSRTLLHGGRLLRFVVGRKQVQLPERLEHLIAGWLIGIPVPLLLISAPTWGWVIVANVLLGINQGLTWSATVIMKIDLAGPERRGLAMMVGPLSSRAWVASPAAGSYPRSQDRPDHRCLRMLSTRPCRHTGFGRPRHWADDVERGTRCIGTSDWGEGCRSATRRPQRDPGA
jgi:hypothetical protein